MSLSRGFTVTAAFRCLSSGQEEGPGFTAVLDSDDEGSATAVFVVGCMIFVCHTRVVMVYGVGDVFATCTAVGESDCGLNANWPPPPSCNKDMYHAKTASFEV